MTLLMAWVVLVSAAIGAAALVVEGLLRARGGAQRAAWIAAMIGVVATTGFAMVAPADTAGRSATLPEMVAMPPSSPAGTPSPAIADRLTMIARRAIAFGDLVLPYAWLLASGLLLGVLAVAHRRLSHERRQARPARLLGHQVFLTERLGPAVAGVRTPVVLVPRWVLALDHPSQCLLLAHESEHVRAHDSRLLTAGAFVAALVPWNPIAWWIVRRLRLAVEQDCDRRVLRANPGVRRYADLLLVAAGSSRLHARILAAHFGEHSSDLERRIHAMTDSRPPWRVLTFSLVAAALLTAGACEAPRPDPIAPGFGEKSVADPAKSYSEYQVEKPVSMLPGSPHPRYPDILRQAGVEGEVLASFVVDESGLADPATLKIIRHTHELFAESVRDGLAAMRFTPAELGGRKVKQQVQQPFSFALPAAGQANREVPVAEAESQRARFAVRRADGSTVPPDVEVLANDGKTVLASSRGNDILMEIPKEGIASIEVWKPTSCPAGKTCPLIQIRLKPGVDFKPPR